MSAGVVNLAGTVEGRSPGVTTTAQGVHKKGGQSLWRVSGKHYDLASFLPRHPGGSRFLLLAREHFPDSTLAFEAHHINMSRALTVLRKFEVPADDVAPPVSKPSLTGGAENKSGAADAGGDKSTGGLRQTPTSPPMLSADDSFFNELKRRVGKYLDSTKRGAGPTDQCLATFAIVLTSWFILFLTTCATGWLTPAVGTGLCGALLAGFGHNWAHQPKYDGWAWVLDLEGESLSLSLSLPLFLLLFVCLPQPTPRHTALLRKACQARTGSSRTSSRTTCTRTCPATTISASWSPCW